MKPLPGERSGIYGTLSREWDRYSLPYNEVFDIVRKTDCTLATQDKKSVPISWTLRGNNTGVQGEIRWSLHDEFDTPEEVMERASHDKNRRKRILSFQGEQSWKARMSSELSIPHTGWRWDGWTSQPRPRMTPWKPGDARLQSCRLVGLVQDCFHYKCLWKWLKGSEQRYYNTVQ